MLSKLISWGCVLVSAIYFYLSLTGIRVLETQRGMILAAFLLLAPLISIATRERRDPKFFLGVSLSIAGFIACVYVIANFQAIQLKVFGAETMDIVMGAILLVTLLEGCRRSMGWGMVSICLVMIAYALFGQNLPGILRHQPISFSKFISYVALTSEGIWGSTLAAAASIIIIFIMFGCFMDAYGAGPFFTDTGLKFFGRLRGGPAKISVATSALFGSISGSPVANVMVTGSFTIPLMKDYGYDAEFVGGVEAAASTGGQIMPPIMGASAFVMAEILGISYWNIVKAAIIPALLYFASIFFMVDFEAGKRNMTSRLEIREVSGKELIKSGWHIVLILAFLFVAMGRYGYSPFRAAGLSIVILTVLYIIKIRGKLSRELGAKILEAMETAFKSSIGVVGACAAAGVIIGVINITGLGVRMADILVSLSGGNIWILMVLAMISSIVLGMGVPTVAAYIILATLVAPALTKLGATKLAAHMFVFYFGILAPVTPPVALGAYAAASISGGDPVKTGFKGCQIAIAAFIVPFMFVRNPAMLLDGTPFTITLCLVTSLIGVYSLAGALEGYMHTFHLSAVSRVMLLAASLLLIDPGLATDAVGIVLFVVGALLSKTLLRVKEVCD